MGKHQSDFEAKVKWLVEHPRLARGWPITVTDRDILTEMREDKLVSEGSHNYDMADLNKAVAEAKHRIRRNK